MARLNESTASAEPIEILKRRFVRQNREIARVNSIQSLRIRSLESEVSHLLSENVSLREQVITLTQELERFEAAKTLHDGVYDVKARLDSKLVEISSLIAELGSLPRQYSKFTREKGDAVPERLSRESTSIKEVNDTELEPYLGHERDGRLPVILEDKYYPRRTLGAQELLELSNNEPNTPGSPGLETSVEIPKEAAEDDEPLIRTPADVMSLNEFVDYARDGHSLPPNLETRKKKRTESILMDEEQNVGKSTSLLDSKFTRKCGAKRKFSAEDEDSLFESAPAEDDGFEFSRPVQSPVRIFSQNDQSSIKRKPQPKAGALNHGQPKRKVLESKSTNINIASPAKPSVSKGYDQHQNLEIPRINENSVPRQGKGGIDPGKRMTPVPHISVSSDEKGTTQDAQEGEVEIRDASPLHDVEHHEVLATADMSNSRPSRRRGAVVSYVEPNLRDKMRRSTNELGPAVSRDKSRRSSSQIDSNQESNEQRSKNTSTKKARSSGITSEEHEIMGNESLESQSKRHVNMISQRKRKTSGRVADDSGDDAIDSQSQGLEIRHERGDEERGDRFADDLSQRQDAIRANTHISLRNVPGNHADVSQAAPDASRKSRRHSSNTRASKQSIAPRFSTTLDVEAVCNDLAAAYSGSSPDELSVQLTKTDEFAADSQGYSDTSFMGSREMARGQRVAARRRSMML
ncbi:hypothetical protein BDV12DRAFT_207874 [Aspergillus spectabilis]